MTYDPTTLGQRLSARVGQKFRLDAAGFAVVASRSAGGAWRLEEVHPDYCDFAHKDGGGVTIPYANLVLAYNKATTKSGKKKGSDAVGQAFGISY